VADATSVHLRVRYFAAARVAAGTAEETLTLTGPVTVADALRTVCDAHGAALGRVLDRCSYLLDEVAVHGTSQLLADAATLDVLPPFAGG
jgi:molybdopterin converting factor small subunit